MAEMGNLHWHLRGPVARPSAWLDDHEVIGRERQPCTKLGELFAATQQDLGKV